MQKKEKVILSIFNAIICIICVLGTLFLFSELEWYLKLVAYLLPILFTIATQIFLLLKYYKYAKSCFVLNVFVGVVLIVFFLLNIFGLFNKLRDLENIKNLILKSGGFGVIVCILIQLLQVVILPAPGFIFYMATTAIYGSVWGFIISYLSTVLGSIIAFMIGKWFGTKAIEWCIGKEDTRKYSSLLNKKGKIPFVIMQLLPFFPDDILCMVAGLSTMSYKFFISTIVLVKPIYIAFVCFLGTGEIIPFNGWGIFVWIAIFAIFILFGIIYYKNQDKIDKWVKNKFSKKNSN